MSDQEITPDQEARHRALDISTSFSVTAPAGSGKTGLLTQRILKLLSVVDRPEAILSITFTRKAAAEMRSRIFELLRQAMEPTKTPEKLNAHEAQGLRLAEIALQQNERLGWNLLENPSRLRIQTIDSFCRRLATSLPLDSGISLPPGVADDVGLLYQTAARRTLHYLESKHSVADDLVFLLDHLSIGAQQLIELIASLMASRDSWLPLVSSQNLSRQWLEEALGQLIQEKFDAAREEISYIATPLSEMISYALTQGGDSLEPALDTAIMFHASNSPEQELDAWQAMANFLLQKGKAQALKTVNKNRGFKAGDKNKTQMHELLNQIDANSALVRNLHGIRDLPNPRVSSEQWSLIQALTRVLNICAAELRLLEQETGLCDHTEVAIAALRALGQPEHPTPLAEKLDYRIQHILVDEFQDTSSTQVNLLECLTAGWQPGDGRTLFVVGDAMQSIYEFRKANVELFRRVATQGVQDIRFDALALTSNFRSRPSLVEKINEIFSNTLGGSGMLQQGFTPARANRSNVESSNIKFGCYSSDKEEARSIAQHVEKLHLQGESDIAILVRNRNHLVELLPALREHKILWRAQEIEPLKERMAVIDIGSLTRAICCPGDRIAWLALLRTPWVGLNNADLLALVELAESEKISLFDAILISSQQPSISTDGKAVLQKVGAILKSAFANLGQLPLRWIIEQSWKDLGGPEGLLNSFDLDYIQDYLELISRNESGGAIKDWEAFDLALGKLYARPSSDNQPGVQIMTMHKAKGLEFDHIILPALAKTSSSVGPNPLLVWWEREFKDGQLRFLLSPKVAKNSDNSLYAYLLEEHKERQLQEQMRILYVAMTRAKESIWMSGCFNLTEDNYPKPPARNALIYGVWEQLKQAFATCSPSQAEILEPEKIRELTMIRRLPVGRTSMSTLPQIDSAEAIINPDFSSRYISRCVGDLLHQDMESLHNRFGETALVNELRESWVPRMQRWGLTTDQIKQATARLDTAMSNLMSSVTARWIFQLRKGSVAEQSYAVLSRSGHVRRLVVDRTFVESGKRWVIDYKTSEPDPNQDLESFISEQLESYRKQLEAYEQIFSDFPVATALYFPLLDELRELS